jgi:hypothetical protein
LTRTAPSGNITRRTLLLAGTGAAASAAIPGLAKASQKALKRRSHVIRATWEDLVGTVLQVQDRWVAPVPVTLVSVTDVPNISKQDARFRSRSFVLLFHGSADPPLGVGIHEIKVKGAGVVQVYFSSATQAGDGWDYVAVFANGKRAQRPSRDPRGKASRKQGRRSGRKARHGKPEAPHKKKKHPKPAPEAKPPAPAPVEPAPAPEPQPAAPAEQFSAAG